jgi:hypothetical protein
MSKTSGVPKVFSPRTLEQFEAASASIPLRPLDRAFETANIRLGKDPGGPEGSRRAQFRRYVASVDQNDARALAKLGAALGALIDEVATSKQDFLVQAAARDGFLFADGVFRPAATAPRSFAQLQLLANDSPKEAIAGAKELLESVRATAAFEDVPAGVDLQPLTALIAKLGTLRKPSPRQARLAVAVAVALAGYVTET